MWGRKKQVKVKTNPNLTDKIKSTPLLENSADSTTIVDPVQPGLHLSNGKAPNRTLNDFEKIDTDGDGFISKEEWLLFQNANQSKSDTPSEATQNPPESKEFNLLDGVKDQFETEEEFNANFTLPNEDEVDLPASEPTAMKESESSVDKGPLAVKHELKRLWGTHSKSGQYFFSNQPVANQTAMKESESSVDNPTISTSVPDKAPVVKTGDPKLVRKISTAEPEAPATISTGEPASSPPISTAHVDSLESKSEPVQQIIITINDPPTTGEADGGGNKLESSSAEEESLPTKYREFFKQYFENTCGSEVSHEQLREYVQKIVPRKESVPQEKHDKEIDRVHANLINESAFLKPDPIPIDSLLEHYEKSWQTKSRRQYIKQEAEILRAIQKAEKPKRKRSSAGTNPLKTYNRPTLTLANKQPSVGGDLLSPRKEGEFGGEKLSPKSKGGVVSALDGSEDSEAKVLYKMRVIPDKDYEGHRIRSDPDLAANNSIGHLQGGDVISVIEEQGDWVKFAPLTTEDGRTYEVGGWTITKWNNEPALEKMLDEKCDAAEPSDGVDDNQEVPEAQSLEAKPSEPSKVKSLEAESSEPADADSKTTDTSSKNLEPVDPEFEDQSMPEITFDDAKEADVETKEPEQKEAPPKASGGGWFSWFTGGDDEEPEGKAKESEQPEGKAEESKKDESEVEDSKENLQPENDEPKVDLDDGAPIEVNVDPSEEPTDFKSVANDDLSFYDFPAISSKQQKAEPDTSVPDSSTAIESAEPNSSGEKSSDLKSSEVLESSEPVKSPDDFDDEASAKTVKAVEDPVEPPVDSEEKLATAKTVEDPVEPPVDSEEQLADTSLDSVDLKADESKVDDVKEEETPASGGGWWSSIFGGGSKKPEEPAKAESEEEEEEEEDSSVSDLSGVNAEENTSKVDENADAPTKDETAEAASKDGDVASPDASTAPKQKTRMRVLPSVQNKKVGQNVRSEPVLLPYKEPNEVGNVIARLEPGQEITVEDKHTDAEGCTWVKFNLEELEEECFDKFGGRKENDKEGWTMIEWKGEQALEEIDTNKDGVVSKEEWMANAQREFERLDVDGDGVISAEERALGAKSAAAATKEPLTYRREPLKKKKKKRIKKIIKGTNPLKSYNRVIYVEQSVTPSPEKEDEPELSREIEEDSDLEANNDADVETKEVADLEANEAVDEDKIDVGDSPDKVATGEKQMSEEGEEIKQVKSVSEKEEDEKEKEEDPSKELAMLSPEKRSDDLDEIIVVPPPPDATDDLEEITSTEARAEKDDEVKAEDSISPETKEATEPAVDSNKADEPVVESKAEESGETPQKKKKKKKKRGFLRGLFGGGKSESPEKEEEAAESSNQDEKKPAEVSANVEPQENPEASEKADSKEEAEPSEMPAEASATDANAGGDDDESTTSSENEAANNTVIDPAKKSEIDPAKKSAIDPATEADQDVSDKAPSKEAEPSDADKSRAILPKKPTISLVDQSRKLVELGKDQEKKQAAKDADTKPASVDSKKANAAGEPDQSIDLTEESDADDLGESQPARGVETISDTPEWFQDETRRRQSTTVREHVSDEDFADRLDEYGKQNEDVRDTLFENNQITPAPVDSQRDTQEKGEADDLKKKDINKTSRAALPDSLGDKSKEIESEKPLVGGEASLGPAWTRDSKMEKPEGTVDMGSYKKSVYTPEQQKRLGVDESGNPLETKSENLPERKENAPKKIGGKAGLGPRWTRDPTFEKPAGTADMGSWTRTVYTPEQQERLGVDENGEPLETLDSEQVKKDASEKSSDIKPDQKEAVEVVEADSAVKSATNDDALANETPSKESSLVDQSRRLADDEKPRRRDKPTAPKDPTPAVEEKKPQKRGFFSYLFGSKDSKKKKEDSAKDVPSESNVSEPDSAKPDSSPSGKDDVADGPGKESAEKSNDKKTPVKIALSAKRARNFSTTTPANTPATEAISADNQFDDIRMDIEADEGVSDDDSSPSSSENKRKPTRSLNQKAHQGAGADGRKRSVSERDRLSDALRDSAEAKRKFSELDKNNSDSISPSDAVEFSKETKQLLGKEEASEAEILALQGGVQKELKKRSMPVTFDEICDVYQDVESEMDSRKQQWDSGEIAEEDKNNILRALTAEHEGKNVVERNQLLSEALRDHQLKLQKEVDELEKRNAEQDSSLGKRMDDLQEMMKQSLSQQQDILKAQVESNGGAKLVNDGFTKVNVLFGLLVLLFLYLYFAMQAQATGRSSVAYH